MRVNKYAVQVLLLVCMARAAGAQCQGKSGFALAACQVAAKTGGSTSGAGIPPAVLQGSKEAALTTGLADTIHPDTLPGAVDPDSKLFSPLLKLERVDDGSFIVKAAGMYEAFLQSYSLDANDSGAGRVAGFYPAPCCKGRRAAVVAAVLKFSELHPDVSQNDIQQLLWAVVAGTDLEKMPAPIQQAAVKILPHDLAVSLQGQAQAQAAKKTLMDYVNGRIRKSPSASAGAGAAGGIATVLNPGAASASGVPASSSLPVERGAWALMPGGFFLRYLPDGCSKIRLQIIVPEALGVSSTAPLLFDPTQFLAVYTQAPALRLGVTLRPAK
jgi:hypothetical protein